MLSDNIRNLRKNNYMSQDELAEKLGVSRQSVSLWENGQTQPTVDNIIAMAKIFNVSADALLESKDGNEPADAYEDYEIDIAPEKKKVIPIVIACAALALVLTASLFIIFKSDTFDSHPLSEETSDAAPPASSTVSDASHTADTHGGTATVETDNSKKNDKTSKPSGSSAASANSNGGTAQTTPPAPSTATSSDTAAAEIDIYEYCEKFAIEKGTLNGDYCIYQQDSSLYGGNKNEYFSISYWNDSKMVEFCLHCPLSDTLSHNFYLRMRGGYSGKYEWLSSKYYRDNGESIRSATGYINPSEFSNSYPISCDSYKGSTDGQDQFMEESRVGMCDLIRCLKKFVEVEKMECEFSDFDFVNF